jgi:hypothetical protein
VRRILPALAAFSALTLASACGSASGGEANDSGSAAHGSGGSSHQVVTITVHQFGGLKPTDTTRVFSAEAKPPDGFTEDDVDAALQAADALAASGLSTPQKLPGGTCSDCFTFNITLSMADGSSKYYSVAGGIRQPKPISDLLSAVS